LLQCPDCGVERRHIGVLYPVRRLCRCETRTCCACTDKAIVTELQAPLKGIEPVLPATSNTVAKFYCKKHCPEDFPLEAPPTTRPRSVSSSRPSSPSSPSIPLSAETIDEEYASPCTPRKVNGAPHIDPVWERASPEKLPMGADFKLPVTCVACKLGHRLKDRKLWNGSYSYCPKCGETMYVPAWDKDEEKVRGQQNK